MASGFIVKRNQYYDSVFLMGVNSRLSSIDGVRKTAVLMASEKNKELLQGFDIACPELDAAQPNDLVVAVMAETDQIVEDVLANVDHAFIAPEGKERRNSVPTLEDALAQQPQANIVSISIPGEYAAREAHKALDAGLHAFIFSSNVSLEDELALKQKAVENNLLVMGPDCGTSLIGGTGLGFTNVVRQGSIGAIGASGTGLQEFTSQIHHAGSGISHAIGIGTNDVSDKIGGLTAFTTLIALEANQATEVIAFVSKPVGPKMLEKFENKFKACKKPIVCCFLGAKELPPGHTNLVYTRTIDDAVIAALKYTDQNTLPVSVLSLTLEEKDRIEQEKGKWDKKQKYLRGIFAGGTFCYQSQQILKDEGIAVYSDSPLAPEYKLADPENSFSHSIVDMGSEYFTVGKPHPMIDGFLRKQRIKTESLDPQVAVIFLDFILGYNASPDPVGELIDAIEQAKRNAHARNAHLTFVASVCGTELDPQDMDLQIQLLEDQGVIVFTSNAKAARFCANLVSKERDQ